MTSLQPSTLIASQKSCRDFCSTEREKRDFPSPHGVYWYIAKIHAGLSLDGKGKAWFSLTSRIEDTQIVFNPGAIPRRVLSSTVSCPLLATSLLRTGALPGRGYSLIRVPLVAAIKKAAGSRRTRGFISSLSLHYQQRGLSPSVGPGHHHAELEMFALICFMTNSNYQNRLLKSTRPLTIPTFSNYFPGPVIKPVLTGAPSSSLTPRAPTVSRTPFISSQSLTTRVGCHSPFTMIPS